MHNHKPHKGTLKRVTVTGRGKVKFRKTRNGHLRSNKTGAKIRHLRRKGVASSGDINLLERMLRRRLIPGDRPRPTKPAVETDAAAKTE